MNIKILLATLLFFSTLVRAQEEENPTVDENSTKNERLKKDVTLSSSRLYLDFSAITPSYFGTNVSGEAYDFRTGFAVGLSAYFSKELGIRAGYDLTMYDNIDEQISGRFDSGRLTHIKLQLFYEYQLQEKLFLKGLVGVASVRYRNEPLANKQVDTGVAAALDFTLSYAPLHFLDVYINAGLYLESLNIKAPPAQQDFFDSATGFYPALGIRIKT